MADVQLNDTALRALVTENPAVRDRVEEAIDFAHDFWAEHARKRTGRMATDTVTEVFVDGDDPIEGVFGVEPFYSRFQNYGTRHIEGQQLLAEIRLRIEAGAF